MLSLSGESSFQVKSSFPSADLAPEAVFVGLEATTGSLITASEPSALRRERGFSFLATDLVVAILLSSLCAARHTRHTRHDIHDDYGCQAAGLPPETPPEWGHNPQPAVPSEACDLAEPPGGTVIIGDIIGFQSINQ